MVMCQMLGGSCEPSFTPCLGYGTLITTTPLHQACEALTAQLVGFRRPQFSEPFEGAVTDWDSPARGHHGVSPTTLPAGRRGPPIRNSEFSQTRGTATSSGAARGLSRHVPAGHAFRRAPPPGARRAAPGAAGGGAQLGRLRGAGGAGLGAPRPPRERSWGPPAA